MRPDISSETRAMTKSAVMAPAPIILVIDDDSAIRNSLRFLLEIEGFEVRLYPTGRDLLAEEDLPSFGCLVVDYKLPDMNGLELLASLRHGDVKLGAVLITTNPPSALRERAALAGVPVVEKPLLSEALMQGVRAALIQDIVS
jgi:two-component system, LuxR family, response regulator FixJ